MPLVAFALAASIAPSEPRGSHAESKRRVEVSASLGYAFPAGSAERGSRVSDVTFGIVPLELDGTYHLTKAVGVGLSVRYAPVIPNLCSAFDDCTGSIGSDVAITAHTRFFLPRLGPIGPAADLGFGYEWFTSRLTDSGVTSSRFYRGPLLLRVDLMAPFRLSSRWTLGPTFGTIVGTFTNGTLDTPASETSYSIDERSVHVWLSVACRLAASF